jgi:hypothetical protein
MGGNVDAAGVEEAQRHTHPKAAGNQPIEIRGTAQLLKLSRFPSCTTENV